MTALAFQVASVVVADVTGNGHASDVAAGAVLTLVLPLALLAIVLLWWWLAVRRGWPALPTRRQRAVRRRRGRLPHGDG